MTARPIRPRSLSSTPSRRHLLGGAGAVLAAGALAACAPEVAPPPAPSTGRPLAEPTPNTTPEQFTAVVQEISGAVEAADEALDAGPLAPRVTGSAAEFRAAAYTMIEEAETFASAWTEALAVPGGELVVPMTSVDTAFPRVAVGLVEDAAGSGVPFFLALVQTDARSPYTTWGWAQQALEVPMPEVPSDQVGSEPVVADSEDLLLTPQAALELYAKVLSDGNGADPDDLLAENPFQTGTHERIQAEREDLNTGVERDEAAVIKEVFTVTPDEIAGLRTADGGAIVLGTLTSSRKVTLRNEGTMSYAEENQFTEIAGTRSFTTEFVRTFGTTVALYVPPADTDAQVQPIGATQTTLSVSGS